MRERGQLGKETETGRDRQRQRETEKGIDTRREVD